MSTFFHSARCNWFGFAYLAAAFFLAGATLAGCSSSKPPAKELEELQNTLKRIEDELIANRQGIPREVEQQLKGLEASLNDPNQWPKDAAAAEKIRQSLDDIVRGLSPGATEKALPQMARLNWGVEALWCTRTDANAPPEQLEETQAIIKEVLDRQPRGQFPDIQKELESRLIAIQPQIRAFQIKQLLGRASRALEGKDDAASVFSSLDEFRGDQEVAEILPKLRQKVVEKTGMERIEGFEKNLAKARSFSDDRVRQVSLLAVQEGVLRLLVDLELDDVAPPEVLKRSKHVLAQCDKEVLALAAKQQDENAKKVRRYQAWALEQIRKFDGPNGWYYDVTLPWGEKELRKFGDATEDANWELFETFPSTRKLVEEKLEIDLSETKGPRLTVAQQKTIFNNLGGVTWKGSINTEIAYRATRDGMVKFLLPIQPHLLDPPVSQLYHETFSKGWKKLEGRDDQLFVAQQSAVVQKKTLDEIASFNP